MYLIRMRLKVGIFPASLSSEKVWKSRRNGTSNDIQVPHECVFVDIAFWEAGDLLLLF